MAYIRRLHSGTSPVLAYQTPQLLHNSFAPFGPLRTANVPVPVTKQFEHLHLPLSLSNQQPTQNSGGSYASLKDVALLTLTSTFEGESALELAPRGVPRPVGLVLRFLFNLRRPEARISSSTTAKEPRPPKRAVSRLSLRICRSRSPSRRSISSRVRISWEGDQRLQRLSVSSRIPASRPYAASLRNMGRFPSKASFFNRNNDSWIA